MGHGLRPGQASPPEPVIEGETWKFPAVAGSCEEVPGNFTFLCYAKKTGSEQLISLKKAKHNLAGAKTSTVTFFVAGVTPNLGKNTEQK